MSFVRPSSSSSGGHGAGQEMGAAQGRAGDSNSWSPGDCQMWARKHETPNANPPPRPGRGDGLLGDMPSMHPPRPPASVVHGHHHHQSRPAPLHKAPRTKSEGSFGRPTWSSSSSSGAMVERRKWSAWVDYRSKVVSQEDMEMESAQRVDVDTVQDLQRCVQRHPRLGQHNPLLKKLPACASWESP
jgi:hypothetical protein